MPKTSAGILAFRIKNYLLEVLLVHPGGPFWKKKDAGAWSIPKGEYELSEEPLKAAMREFREELGIEVKGDFISLDVIKQKGGKKVQGYAVEFDADVENITSNLINVEWPPKSGKQISIPEVDKAGWFNIIDAGEKINASQSVLIDDLLRKKFGLRDDQIDKVKLLGNIIKQGRLINFYYESGRGKDFFAGDRKVEPYMVAKYNIDNRSITLTGYFWPTEDQPDKPRGQRNYLIDEIDLSKFELLDETFETIKVDEPNIHNTRSMTVLYKSDRPFQKME